MASPLVSVVVTSYNYARYIGRTIESVLAQSYPSIELIVVDDGSTDDSLAVIARYAGRCRCIPRENGGEGAASNTGFAASRGEIVLFLDSDDILYPDAISAVVGRWSPGTAKVQFYLDNIDAEGCPLGGRMPNLPFVADEDIPALVRHYGYYPSPPTSGNAYSRGFLEAVMPVREHDWRRGVDGYLNALAALSGRVLSISKSLGAYRIHDRNMSGASGLDLRKLRFSMKNEIDREAAIKQHAAARGEIIAAPLALRIPAHCKARIVSLRLDPSGHPVPGDRMADLVGAGVAAACRFPHLGLGKRIAAALGFLMLPWIPAALLRHGLEPLFRSEKRLLASRLRALRPIGAAAEEGGARP